MVRNLANCFAPSGTSPPSGQGSNIIYIATIGHHHAKRSAIYEPLWRRLDPGSGGHHRGALRLPQRPHRGVRGCEPRGVASVHGEARAAEVQAIGAPIELGTSRL